MKKILSILLALMLLISVGTVMAFAAGEDVQFIVTPSNDSPKPGDEVTFTIELDIASGKNVSIVSFGVDADAGLTYKSHMVPEDGPFPFNDFGNGNGFFLASAFGGSVTGKVEMCQITYTVDNGTEGKNLQVKINTTTQTGSHGSRSFILDDSNNTPLTYSITNGSVKVKSAATGVNVSGAVTSYTVGSMTGAEKVTVSLLNGDAVVSSQQVTTGYNFSNVSAGTYTLKVEKLNHVTRNYTVTVGSVNVTQDVKICPKGDANSDGAVKLADYALVLAHVKGTKLITDAYALACVDVNGDGAVKLADYALVLAHVKGTKSLF